MAPKRERRDGHPRGSKGDLPGQVVRMGADNLAPCYTWNCYKSAIELECIFGCLVNVGRPPVPALGAALLPGIGYWHAFGKSDARVFCEELTHHGSGNSAAAPARSVWSSCANVTSATLCSCPSAWAAWAREGSGVSTGHIP